MDWQTAVALIVVALAVAWCGRTLYSTVHAALHPRDATKSGCGGCCGSHTPKLGGCSTNEAHK